MIPREFNYTVETGDWIKTASCSEPDMNPEWWFPINEAYDDYPTKTAINICKTCPVKRQCLEYALITWPVHGIWGGYKSKQIRVMKQEIERQK